MPKVNFNEIYRPKTVNPIPLLRRIEAFFNLNAKYMKEEFGNEQDRKDLIDMIHKINRFGENLNVDEGFRMHDKLDALYKKYAEFNPAIKEHLAPSMER